MKHLIFSIVILFISVSIVSSQNRISGKITDIDSKPLQFVNIGIIGTSFGTVCDLQGSFQFKYESLTASNTDTLQISHIGYETKKIPFDSIKRLYKNSDFVVFKLINRNLELNEVIIKANRKITKEIGYLNVSLLNLRVNFAIPNTKNDNLGSEIGKKYNIKHNNTLISKLKFKIRQNNFDSTIFRINIYSVKHNMPDKNLLKESVLISITDKKTDWIEVDLSKYRIIVNNDIIVSIEWVAKSDSGNILSLPIAMPTPHIHYYKYGSQSNWKRYLSMTTMMKLEIKY